MLLPVQELLLQRERHDRERHDRDRHQERSALGGGGGLDLRGEQPGPLRGLAGAGGPLSLAAAPIDSELAADEAQLQASLALTVLWKLSAAWPLVCSLATRIATRIDASGPGSSGAAQARTGQGRTEAVPC